MKNLFVSVTSIVIALFASAHAITVELDDRTVTDGMIEIEQDGFTIRISAYTVEGNQSDPSFSQLDEGLISDERGVGVDRGFGDADQVDGFGPNEAVFFEIFDSASGVAVEFNSISFNAVGFNDDVAIAAGSNINDLDLVYQGDIPGVGNGQELLLNNVVASALMVAALEPSDGFFIQSISFEPIPVPGAALLMLGGMGALSFARKKRRAA